MSPYTPDAGRIIRPEPVRVAVLAGRIRPLSRSLALALLDRCCAPGPWRVEAQVVPDPPASLDELTARWPGEGTPVPVSGEHARDTVWGHPDLNALYRAWHDSLHVLLDAPFDLPGETLVGMREAQLPDNGGDAAILRAEGVGQAIFNSVHGCFPRRQRAFVVYAVRFGLGVAVVEGGRFL